MYIKKVLILVVVLLLSANIYCQKNTVYALVQPIDMGYGIRFDRRINDFGLYTSLSKGEYDIPGEYYIEKHIKMSLGGVSHTRRGSTFFSYGFNYNFYGDTYLSEGTSRSTTYPMSIELGAGALLSRVAVAFRMDVLKWESSLDLGFRF